MRIFLSTNEGALMPTLFTRIIQGEIPGQFVHQDEHCVAFLSIHPLTPGHTLVVPRAEIDHWIDLSADLRNHLMEVAQKIGAAQMKAFLPLKIGLMFAGLEVPHVHLHVVPMNGPHDLDFARANVGATSGELSDAAERIRRTLA
jgi:histidine triad (HIT) family protein